MGRESRFLTWVSLQACCQDEELAYATGETYEERDDICPGSVRVWDVVVGMSWSTLVWVCYCREVVS